ncbi:MAG: RNA-binding S4 domain-containing protein [Fidelibacterota bacterium]|nr:MAG: RNA-binding S4 domain-containing protein [Candidatus Neomarinimicrobiota bacterium]
MTEVRLDKWLWAARLYKTRRGAAEACQAGKVKLNGRSVKPGKSVKAGDDLLITRKLYKQQIRIVGLQERRVAPKIAITLYEDLTPAEDIEQSQLVRTMESAFYRDRRKAGRPTKRDRRAMQKLKGKF